MALVNEKDAAQTKDAAKAKKAESLKKFKERRAVQLKQRYESALKLADELKKTGALTKLPGNLQEFVASLCVDPALKQVSAAGSSVFTQLFGSAPKIGDVVTLRDVFDKTNKGMSTIDIYVKRWLGSGITVTKKLDLVDLKKTTYTITALK